MDSEINRDKWTDVVGFIIKIVKVWVLYSLSSSSCSSSFVCFLNTWFFKCPLFTFPVHLDWIECISAAHRLPSCLQLVQTSWTRILQLLIHSSYLGAFFIFLALMFCCIAFLKAFFSCSMISGRKQSSLINPLSGATSCPPAAGFMICCCSFWSFLSKQ